MKSQSRLQTTGVRSEGGASEGVKHASEGVQNLDQYELIKIMCKGMERTDNDAIGSEGASNRNVPPYIVTIMHPRML